MIPNIKTNISASGGRTFLCLSLDLGLTGEKRELAVKNVDNLARAAEKPGKPGEGIKDFRICSIRYVSTAGADRGAAEKRGVFSTTRPLVENKRVTGNGSRIRHDLKNGRISGHKWAVSRSCASRGRNSEHSYPTVQQLGTRVHEHSILE